MDRRGFLKNAAIPYACGLIGGSVVPDCFAAAAGPEWLDVIPVPDAEEFEMNISLDFVPRFLESCSHVVESVGELRERLFEDRWPMDMPILRMRDQPSLPQQTVRFSIYGTEVLRQRIVLADSHDPAIWFAPFLLEIERIARHYFRLETARLPDIPRAEIVVTN